MIFNKVFAISASFMYNNGVVPQGAAPLLILEAKPHDP